MVASPFQLGWKAVAVKSKHLPQVLFGMLTLFDPPVDTLVFDPPVVEPLLVDAFVFDPPVVEPLLVDSSLFEVLAEASFICDVA